MTPLDSLTDSIKPFLLALPGQDLDQQLEVAWPSVQSLGGEYALGAGTTWDKFRRFAEDYFWPICESAKEHGADILDILLERSFLDDAEKVAIVLNFFMVYVLEWRSLPAPELIIIASLLSRAFREMQNDSSRRKLD